MAKATVHTFPYTTGLTALDPGPTSCLDLTESYSIHTPILLSTASRTMRRSLTIPASGEVELGRPLHVMLGGRRSMRGETCCRCILKGKTYTAIFASQSAFGVTVGGEFSCGFNDCGLFLKGVPGSSTYGGDCSLWEDSSTWNDTVKNGLKQFSMASMDAIGDFFFWTVCLVLLFS